MLGPGTVVPHIQDPVPESGSRYLTRTMERVSTKLPASRRYRYVPLGRFSASKVAAFDESTSPIHNIFIDTLYGMAIGFALGAAFSAAKGKDGRDLIENIGAGAAVGGLLGASYGIVLEYKGMAEIRNNEVCFHVPSVTFSSPCGSGETILHTDLLQFHF